MGTSRNGEQDILGATADAPATDPSAVIEGRTDLDQQPARLISDRESNSLPLVQAPLPTSSSGSVAVVVPPVERPWEYHVYQDDTTIAMIQEEIVGQYEYKYIVRFADGHDGTISRSELSTLTNGSRALSRYQAQLQAEASTSDDSAVITTATKHRLPRRSANRAAHAVVMVDSSSDELVTATTGTLRKRRAMHSPKRRGRKAKFSDPASRTSSSVTSDDIRKAPRSGGRSHSMRKSAGQHIDYREVPVSNEFESSDDDRPTVKRSRGRPSLVSSTMKPRAEGARRSSRARKPVYDVPDGDEDDVSEVGAGKGLPKAVGAKERFQSLPKDSDFRCRHNLNCDACDDQEDEDEKGLLVYCQGCSVSYHQKCLGPRNTRDHLVTKVRDIGFVLQCRRCIEFACVKEPTTPRQGSCQGCHVAGNTSKPFRTRQTTREEERARTENEGEDPSVKVSSDLINNASNVLFRCVLCHRAFHWHHLPPKQQSAKLVEEADEGGMAAMRFTEYSKHWSCRECNEAPAEIDALVAWRPVNINSYIPGHSNLNEDEKEYLVKYKEMSYLKCAWMPGAWVWGVTSPAMRKAFAKRESQPEMRTEDAIPEEYVRVDIVFDVEYTNVVKVQDEAIDKARIKEVERALVKFKGLGYEDAVWEEVPRFGERWDDFRDAYNDWVMARYIHIPKQLSLNAYIAKLRSQNFEKKIMMEKQPGNLTGGDLMAYQMEGLNWLYYQWHKEQNAILADEMGLGKTIQIIGFLATLKIHGCWPFLIVVPNSTCANWRREIKLWAPSLRVVTYFGSAEAKRLALKHELFHGHSKDLKCHVVVTSYDAAQDEEFRRVFRGVSWRGLVVDEGQRLKNDKNLLYGALNALRVPFKVLLTGTPLQNNARELFNLLQFLDRSIDAQAMEEEYTTLTKENVPKLHDLLRPFFLRRTKAQVLNFLPSMAQIIVPVTLTVLQKKLYKSILAKNQELIKSIFGGSTRLHKTERANLNNILMQLRKCLCHPFVYSRDIEERNSNPAISHRNLVDASSKLQLLEIMLPKLQERGHRVLIFSQFLDMLDMVEDFLDGLGLYYQRLDGTLSSLQKQKRIDEFNAPDSSLFAFLLSTRAGGVGINLATADTVIILDPDFNPHQDIQALSRAHRIGQKKKVLVFQLTTRSTAEEKIMQIGKKKMALDHVLIDQLDAEDDASMDLESILRYGTEALFQDDSQDIKYDSVSVDKLLDRSQVEDTQTGKDDSAESQFSFARVWANDKATLEDTLGDSESKEHAPDPSLWEKILKEREEEVAQEAAARAEALGRGKRKRQVVDYGKETRDIVVGSSPRRDPPKEADSDTDFQARPETDLEDSGDETLEDVNTEELNLREQPRPSRSIYEPQTSTTTGRTGSFKRVILSPEKYIVQPTSATTQAPSQLYSMQSTSAAASQGPILLQQSTPSVGRHASSQALPLRDIDHNIAQPSLCLACDTSHSVGYCPLKLANVEHCPLCGIAHYGHQRTCPHLNSITQCRTMLDALKHSPAPTAEIEMAKKYIVGIIGDLQRRKRIKEEKALLESSKHTFASNQARGPGAGRYPALQTPDGPVASTGARNTMVNGTSNGIPPSRGG